MVDEDCLVFVVCILISHGKGSRGLGGPKDEMKLVGNLYR